LCAAALAKARARRGAHGVRALPPKLIIELKTAKTLASEHEAQILGYLKSARLEHGLLINFGSYKFEIRKFTWTERQSQKAQRVAGLLLSAIYVFFAVKR
jgi:hypothetical protein